MVRRRSIVRRVLGRIHGTSSSDEDTRPAPEPRAQANPDVAPDAAKGPSVEGIGRTGLEVQALAGEIASRQGGLAGSDPRSMLVGARPRYGLSKGVSRLMRAGEAILRRGSLAVSRWEKVPADFGPDREPPTWLEPRPRDAAQPSEVSAAALSTPAHAPVSPADRPNAGQGVSPKAEHRRTAARRSVPARETGRSAPAGRPMAAAAAGRIRRRTGRPGISRRIATSVDRPVVSKIGRAVARIPIEPMVPRDRWTPREMEIERPSGDDPSEGSGPSRLEARPVRHGLATEPLGAPASRTASVETRGPTAGCPSSIEAPPEVRRRGIVQRSRRVLARGRERLLGAPSGAAGDTESADTTRRAGAEARDPGPALDPDPQPEPKVRARLSGLLPRKQAAERPLGGSGPDLRRTLAEPAGSEAAVRQEVFPPPAPVSRRTERRTPLESTPGPAVEVGPLESSRTEAGSLLASERVRHSPETLGRPPGTDASPEVRPRGIVQRSRRVLARGKDRLLGAPSMPSGDPQSVETTHRAEAEVRDPGPAFDADSRSESKGPARLSGLLQRKQAAERPPAGSGLDLRKTLAESPVTEAAARQQVYTSRVLVSRRTGTTMPPEATSDRPVVEGGPFGGAPTETESPLPSERVRRSTEIVHGAPGLVRALAGPVRKLEARVRCKLSGSSPGKNLSRPDRTIVHRAPGPGPMARIVPLAALADGQDGPALSRGGESVARGSTRERAALVARSSEGRKPPSPGQRTEHPRRPPLEVARPASGLAAAEKAPPRMADRFAPRSPGHGSFRNGSSGNGFGGPRVPAMPRGAAGGGGSQPPPSRIQRLSEGGDSTSGPIAATPRGGSQEKKGTGEFTAEQIEFLASKVHSYLMQRLTVEAERHGRPTYTAWS